MDALFRDCLGREIKVGDVIASGYRDGDRGNVFVGVVTGFHDDKAIKVTKFHRGFWAEYRNGQGHYWMPSAIGDMYQEIKGRSAYGERCFVTGLTEDELRARLPAKEHADHA